jgi:hypothetical protein
MVHVVVSRKAPPADLLREGDPSAVVYDLDAPFDEVVEAMMPRREVPGPGFVAQARRNASDRIAFLETHGALIAEQVAHLAGSTAANRSQTAHRWAAERRIFGVEYGGRTTYPGFQFDPETRKPLPQVREVLARLPAGLAGSALALWWETSLRLACACSWSVRPGDVAPVWGAATSPRHTRSSRSRPRRVSSVLTRSPKPPTCSSVTRPGSGSG